MATKKSFYGTYWINRLEESFLFQILKNTPGDFLEIGSYDGIIATLVAKKFPNKTIHCVDLFKKGYSTAAGHKRYWKRNVAEHKVTNIKLFEGDSRKIIPRLKRKYGLIFIDGDHSYRTVLRDLENSWKRLLPKGILVFHDYGKIKDVTRAADEFCISKNKKTILVMHSLGLIPKNKKISKKILFIYLIYRLFSKSHNLLVRKLRKKEEKINKT